MAGGQDESEDWQHSHARADLESTAVRAQAQTPKKIGFGGEEGCPGKMDRLSEMRGHPSGGR